MPRLPRSPFLGTKWTPVINSTFPMIFVLDPSPLSLEIGNKAPGCLRQPWSPLPCSVHSGCLASLLSHETLAERAQYLPAQFSTSLDPGSLSLNVLSDPLKSYRCQSGRRDCDVSSASKKALAAAMLWLELWVFHQVLQDAPLPAGCRRMK